MIKVRKSEDRGRAEHGWLSSRHTFSFADYHDRNYMAYRSLRVINEDWVAPGQGFGTHSHNDMEIITYVLSGAVEHKDSMGNKGLVRPGEVQYMNAGTGVRHSEFNPSPDETLHLLQIWIMPPERGSKPAYGQIRLAENGRAGRLQLVAGKNAPEGSIPMLQDIQLYASVLKAGDKVEHRSSKGRGLWLQLVKGDLEMNGITLSAGDGAVIEQEETVSITAKSESEFLLFDMA